MLRLLSKHCLHTGQWVTPKVSWLRHPDPVSRSSCQQLFVIRHHKHWKIHYIHPVFMSQLISPSPPPAHQSQFLSVNTFFFLVSNRKRAFTGHDLPGRPHTSTVRGESHSDLRCRHLYFVTPHRWQHSPACVLCYLLLSKARLFCDTWWIHSFFAGQVSHQINGIKQLTEGSHEKLPHRSTWPGVREWETPL